ncbi:YlbF family regulator [Fervidibacillus halotolerans]|uniref:UPF0342 protein OE105_02410 n=1 Tax=Fervidibacillus halotolerans TaxID=2980027 RepID=A0A9E8M040_9BACI|nr:YlbF family regulator [Fervidibacillus halotolerans]WAA12998.1 YlbF family regulator [Fervidibacillus halotolerans]
MSVEVYNIAENLEKTIRESDEFTQLKTQYDKVFSDEPTKRMFENFRNIQLSLQEKQMMGQPISEEEVQKAQQIAALIQQNDLIAQLLEAEQRMSTLIAEVNKIVMKPLEELYNDQMK